MQTSPLYMTGAYVNLLSGTGPVALLGAVMGHIARAKPYPHGVLPIMMAAHPELEDKPLLERIISLLIPSLSEAYRFLRRQGVQKILVALLLPFDRLPAFPNTAIFAKMLGLESDVAVLYCRHFKHATLAFQTLCHQWDHTDWEAVIFGGSDSLIDMETCRALSEKIKVKIQGKSEGLVPGEGAACVVLQRFVPPFSSTKNYLGNFYCDSSGLGGISSLPISTTCLIQSANFSVASAVKWHQTLRDLFPKQCPEQLDTQIALGEIGCASVPVGMALSWARFLYPYQPVSHIAVCETNYGMGPGVVVMERYETV